MHTQELIIDKKKYFLIPAKEYVSLQEDMADLKIVLERRKEKGMEAKTFFKNLATKRATKTKAK